MSQNSIIKFYDKLPTEFALNNEKKLVKTTKSKSNHTRGRNNLKDLEWVVYKFTDGNADSSENGYTHILFMPYCIIENIRTNASKNLVCKQVSTAERPHIDAKTGNVHPEKLNPENYTKIEQLILVRVYGENHGGPNLKCDDYNEKDYYTYKAEDKNKTAYVHKACYYPLIDENDENVKNLKNNWRYKLLEEIWEKLHKALK